MRITLVKSDNRWPPQSRESLDPADQVFFFFSPPAFTVFSTEAAKMRVARDDSDSRSVLFLGWKRHGRQPCAAAATATAGAVRGGTSRSRLPPPAPARPPAAPPPRASNFPVAGAGAEPPISPDGRRRRKRREAAAVPGGMRRSGPAGALEPVGEGELSRCRRRYRRGSAAAACCSGRRRC